MADEQEPKAWKQYGVDNPIHLLGIPAMALLLGLNLSVYALDWLIKKLPGLKLK